MTVQDLQLNCSVRGVLARHWIEPQRVSYRARRGHVHLSGEIKMLGAGEGQQRTAVALLALELELRRLRGVNSVQFELTNWVRDEAGTWTCTEKDEHSTHSNLAGPAKQGEILDLSAGRGKR